MKSPTWYYSGKFYSWFLSTRTKSEHISIDSSHQKPKIEYLEKKAASNSNQENVKIITTIFGKPIKDHLIPSYLELHLTLLLCHRYLNHRCIQHSSIHWLQSSYLYFKGNWQETRHSSLQYYNSPRSVLVSWHMYRSQQLQIR